MTEKAQPPLPSPEVVRDLVKVGVEQIRVRQQELDLQEKESQRQYDFAKEALAVQAEDRRDSRKYRRKRDLDRYIFVGIIVALVISLILTLSYMGKEELAKEITKVAASFVAGGLSGYGLAKNRNRRETETEDDSTPPD
jgi:hypothetical protein